MSDNLNANFYEKKEFILKGLAFLLGSAAIYMLWVVWIPAITKHKFDFPFDGIFLLFFSAPCTVLAIYFFHAAVIIWRGISSKGIRKLSVCLSFLLAILLLILVSGIRKSCSSSYEVFWNEVTTSFIMVASGVFYLLIKPWLFKSFSVNEVIDYNAHRKATKLYFGFLVFFTWSTFLATIQLLPKHPDHEYLPSNYWLASLLILGPIPLAFWGYRTGLKFFLKNPHDVNICNGTTAEFLGAESSPG